MSTLMDRAVAPHSNEPLGELEGVSYYNVCYAGFPRHELNVSDHDYAVDRNKALTRACKDGVKPMTKEEQDAERELNWVMIKRFTMAIFKIDTTRFSFPVGYSEPRTFMERSADLFAFLVSSFLERACQTSMPEDRLVNVAAGVIASFHLCLQSKKPWNPVLGETYVGRWENGTSIYGEQISHHPPISAIQVRPVDNKWKIDAKFCFGIDQGLLQIDVLQKGITTLRFDDGTVIQWEFPTIRAVGILTGDRIVRMHGEFQMKDLTHQLEANIKIWPKASKRKGIVAPRATTVWGGVRVMNGPKEQFCRMITGDYAGELFIGGESVWKLDNCFSRRPLVTIENGDLLPSDCRYRLDRAKMILGNVDGAEAAKVLLESLQRREGKMRVSNGHQ